MLHNSNFSLEVKKKWSLAYWCFYHAGVSSKICESEDFYGTMQLAHYEKWPRGSERRHFRGNTSLNTIKFFKENFPNPVDAVNSILKPTFAETSKAVQIWPAFGPWISFKIADMADRVLENPVDFSNCELQFYKEPAKGGKIVAEQWGESELDLASVVKRLGENLSDLLAPPDYKRKLSIQEIETILCKYKSHLNGHYPPGKDTKEIYHGLEGWGNMAEEFRRVFPNVEHK